MPLVWFWWHRLSSLWDAGQGRPAYNLGCPARNTGTWNTGRLVAQAFQPVHSTGASPRHRMESTPARSLRLCGENRPRRPTERCPP